MANKVKRLIEKLNNNIKKHTPINDKGMVKTGIKTERSAPRNIKITNITIKVASTIVLITSLIDFLELL